MLLRYYEGYGCDLLYVERDSEVCSRNKHVPFTKCVKWFSRSIDREERIELVDATISVPGDFCRFS